MCNGTSPLTLPRLRRGSLPLPQGERENGASPLREGSADADEARGLAVDGFEVAAEAEGVEELRHVVAGALAVDDGDLGARLVEAADGRDGERDGLPKMKDFPAEFGGSGETVAE